MKTDQATNTQVQGVGSTEELGPASPYRFFGGMTWAVPGERMDDLARALTFAPEDHVFTMSERLTIRSFLDCYRELVALPEKTRNKRVREIRKGPGNGGL